MNSRLLDRVITNTCFALLRVRSREIVSENRGLEQNESILIAQTTRNRMICRFFQHSHPHRISNYAQEYSTILSLSSTDIVCSILKRYNQPTSSKRTRRSMYVICACFALHLKRRVTAQINCLHHLLVLFVGRRLKIPNKKKTRNNIRNVTRKISYIRHSIKVVLTNSIF